MRGGNLWQATSTLSWSSGSGIKGEIVFVSLGQRKCKIEKN